MNAESPASGPAQLPVPASGELPLPLSGIAVVLSKSMDQLFMDTIRPLSLEADPEIRAELGAIAILIVEGGKEKAAHLPAPPKAACILLEGELRILAGGLKRLVSEDSQPARSMIFELLVLLVGNGWRREEQSTLVRR